MKNIKLSEQTQRILKNHFNVNSFDDCWIISLQRTLNNQNMPGRAELFKDELADMIMRNILAPKEYEELTGEDFDSPEELNQWLRTVWEKLYSPEIVEDFFLQ